jgi:hypothetical protein
MFQVRWIVAGKISARRVSTSTLKLLCDQGETKVKSNCIVYFGAKVCLYIGRDSYNYLCQAQLVTTDIREDDSR